MFPAGRPSGHIPAEDGVPGAVRPLSLHGEDHAESIEIVFGVTADIGARIAPGFMALQDSGTMLVCFSQGIYSGLETDLRIASGTGLARSALVSTLRSD